VGVVGGAVQGIDDPARPFFAPALGPTALLAQHAVCRESPQEDLPDHPLGSLVDLGDEVHLSLEPDGLFPAEVLA
jgi:hypothetical protein